MRVKLILVVTLLLLAGCKEKVASPTESPSPIASSSTPTPVSRESAQEILNSIKNWSTPEEALLRVHPDVRQAMTPEDEARFLRQAKSNFTTLYEEGAEVQVKASTARPTIRRHFPILPTHAVGRSNNDIAYFHLRIEGTDWHLTPWLTTEAVREAAKDAQDTPEEREALADKILKNLSPEQIEILKKEFRSGGKVPAIRALRDMDAHGLAVQKMVIDRLAEEN